MCSLNVNNCSKAACLDEGQQEDEEDEGVGASSKFMQPKLTTISKAVHSLENVAGFIENKECTFETSQVCHFRDLEAALSYSEHNITPGSQLWMIFSLTMYLMHAVKMLLYVPQISVWSWAHQNYLYHIISPRFSSSLLHSNIKSLSKVIRVYCKVSMQTTSLID